MCQKSAARPTRISGPAVDQHTCHLQQDSKLEEQQERAIAQRSQCQESCGRTAASGTGQCEDPAALACETTPNAGHHATARGRARHWGSSRWQAAGSMSPHLEGAQQALLPHGQALQHQALLLLEAVSDVAHRCGCLLAHAPSAPQLASSKPLACCSERSSTPVRSDWMTVAGGMHRAHCCMYDLW